MGRIANKTALNPREKLLLSLLGHKWENRETLSLHSCTCTTFAVLSGGYILTRGLSEELLTDSITVRNQLKRHNQVIFILAYCILCPLHGDYCGVCVSLKARVPVSGSAAHTAAVCGVCTP